MNENPRHDEIERDWLLDGSSPHDDELVNTLANTIPQIDPVFQRDLQQQLMAQLQAQTSKKGNYLMQFSSAHLNRPRFTLTWLPWAATLLVIAAGAALLFYMNRFNVPALLPAAAEQVETEAGIVIITQPIAAGSVITDESVGIVHLSDADLAELRASQPEREFYADVSRVIGQKAASDLDWFEPVDDTLLGASPTPCPLPETSCLEAEGLYTISFPYNETVDGLEHGSRVDVLAMVNDELRVVAENVLLTEIEPTMVTLAAPSWQQSVLIWLYQTHEPYALRTHSGSLPPVLGTSPVEYAFTAPEALPEDYRFNLIVGLPASKGYLLTDVPASIDEIPFTENGDTMQFWFYDIDVVSIVDGTNVIIRLPERDAAALQYFLEQDASLSFIPD